MGCPWQVWIACMDGMPAAAGTADTIGGVEGDDCPIEPAAAIIAGAAIAGAAIAGAAVMGGAW